MNLPIIDQEQSIRRNGMTAHPKLIKQSELLNQLVLDRSTMEELGRVEVLWMSPQVHRVLGFIGKSGFLGAKKAAFKLIQIDALGAGSILTHGQPEATDAEKVQQLESPIDCEVWNDAGEKIGSITDYIFNLKTGDITQYLLITNRWSRVTGDIYQLPPSQIISVGRKRILVPDAAVQTLTVYQAGMKQKITQASSAVKAEYDHVTEEVRSLSQKAQSATHETQERLQNLAEQVKQQAQSLTVQAQEKAHTLNEQLQTGTQTFTTQAKATSQTWVEQVKEQSQTIGEQIEAGIQTLTVEAQEIFDPVVKTDGDTPSTSAPDANSANAKDDSDWDDDDWGDWDDDDWESSHTPASKTQAEPPLENGEEEDWESPSTTVPAAASPTDDQDWEDDDWEDDDWEEDWESPPTSPPSSKVESAIHPTLNDEESLPTPASSSHPEPPTQPIVDDDDEPWI
ncbi:MAG: hypothetical protein F6K19_35850 [Cyanothece sp. SIO1E1]|nr:hypothetical protein [Cyanothece sp. SIO1E1]